MRALRIHGPRDARLDEIAEPELTGDDQVKVRIQAAGICGSDLWLYTDAPIPDELRHPAFGESGPHVLGHEFAGQVVAVGQQARGVRIGDLVAVRPLVADQTCPACLRGETNLCATRGVMGVSGGGGGFSDWVVAAADQVHLLPAHLTAESGALVEPLATSWRTVSSAMLTGSERVVVVGAGPIGLGVLLCLQARGCRDVLVSDPRANRRATAAALGVSTVDPLTENLPEVVNEWTAHEGADVVFDCAGAPGDVMSTELSMLRQGGALVVTAQFHTQITIDPAEFSNGAKRIVGSFAYTAEDFDAVIAAMADGRLDPSSMITARIDLESVIDDGIEHLLGAGRDSDIKILVANGTPR
jgi:(R,R)-butanediol dehydrogenase/meso-butanediol dehydrogenase/diacetyl reductase